MNVRILFGCAALLVVVSGCTARSAQLPVVQMRFYETPSDGAAKERINEQFALNVAVIGDATLRYTRPSELLNAAETAAGGDPVLLMRAGRTLTPGEGVVLLGTVRSQEAAGGSASTVSVYTLALACDQAELDKPGDLKSCKGYVMRVPKTWPGEVYAIEDATVTIIPEGGTARGRIHAKSVPGGFKAELEGEFAASVVELYRAEQQPVVEEQP